VGLGFEPRLTEFFSSSTSWRVFLHKLESDATVLQLVASCGSHRGRRFSSVDDWPQSHGVSGCVDGRNHAKSDLSRGDIGRRHEVALRIRHQFERRRGDHRCRGRAGRTESEPKPDPGAVGARPRRERCRSDSSPPRPRGSRREPLEEARHLALADIARNLGTLCAAENATRSGAMFRYE